MNSRKVGIHRKQGEELTFETDDLACETLINLQQRGETFTSLLGTPDKLQELYLGHLASEYSKGVSSDNYASIEVIPGQDGSFAVNSTIDFTLQSRTDLVTSSCGACDKDGLAELNAGIICHITPLEFDASKAHDLLERMRELQHGFQLTGGLHGAGIANSQGDLLAVSEDIGRHNAVDKIIGHSIVHDYDMSKQILLLSGRIGWDIVAKAARMNIPLIISKGAASSLAAATARQFGITLITFVTKDKAVIIGPKSSP